MESAAVIPSAAVKKGIAGHKRWQRMNRPEAPYVGYSLALLESPAWAAMPLAARRVVERIAIEHMNHGGTRNGALIVTYDDFVRFGIRRRSIRLALAIAIALGFLDLTYRGGRVHGRVKRPSTYGLTWYPRCDMTPASNRWRNIKTPEQAAACVRRAKAVAAKIFP